MKKRGLILCLGAMVLSAGVLVGCGKTEVATPEIAVVTDVGSLMDGGFNEGTYEGAKEYAEKNNLGYKYYQPANGSNATDNDRIAAYNQAVKNGAKIIVAPGFLQYNAMQTVAMANPDVKFVFIDGWPVVDTDNKVLSNVTSVSYKEQEAGYFAGYGAAMDGFKKFGGTFGGGGTNPACNRFGWGYVQGIEAAAAAQKLTDKLEVKMSYKYGEGFSASSDLQTQIGQWYSSGTEIVFSCGGSMFNSVIAAVGSAKDRYIIGVDTDQHKYSDQIITSATKGLAPSVVKVLGQFYSGSWDSVLGGKLQTLGAADDATGLPTEDASWGFKTFTKDQYNSLYNDVKSGKVVPNGEVGEDINSADWWTNATKLMTHVNVVLDK